MGKYVAFTSEFGLDLIAEVGGKGANLGELTRAGFRTPPAFSVKIQGFDSFLEANNLNDPISEIALSIDYKQMSDVEQKTAQIRKMISSAVLPEDIAAEIRDAYMQLQDGGDPPLVAVRSSVGTRDLSQSSFPGQMDTYHNIINAEEVLARVKECWASMWTSRAACTIHAKGIDYRMIIIAPLVQLMVPSETAGVAFTVNPLTGNKEELLIDAGYGLGEAVVSGKITPDHYVIGKEKREIKAVTSGYKKFKIELDGKKGHGNCRIELSEEEAVKECLAPEQIKEIAGLGIEVEKHYRCPQDVEWAYAGGKLYILQARRITGLDDLEEMSTVQVPEKPENVWSRKFGDEYLAEYQLPLCYAMLTKWIIEDYLKEWILIVGRRDLADLEPLRNYNGYVYFSGLFAVKTLSAFPKTARESEVISWYPSSWNERIMSEPFRPGKLPEMIIGPYLRDFKRSPITKNEDALMQHCVNIERSILPLLNQDYISLSKKEWKRQFDEANEFGKEHFRIIRWGMAQHSPLLHSLTEKYLKRWADDDGELYQGIISGIPGTKTAEINRAIWRMGLSARKDDLIRKLLLAPEHLSYEETRNKSAESVFWQEFDLFINQHGHRAATRDISQPRWKETPDVILGFVRAQLHTKEAPADPEIKTNESRRIRKNMEQEAIGRTGGGLSGFLFGFMRRIVLEKLFKLTRRYTRYRENQRYHLDYILTHIRGLLCEQGRRFTEKRIIKEISDIFFLEAEEFWHLFDNPVLSDEIALKIETRRKHYIDWKDRLPATYLYDDIETEGDDADEELSGDVIKGIGASSGNKSGAARIIDNLSHLDHIQPGEILITANIDPGWTNVFPLLGGLITETGGLLAHGALLAREYGIPAVMGVPHAMQKFQNGDMLELDGKAGTIRRMKLSHSEHNA
ncbi:MAG: hypothetical protein HF978_17345 [Desulfobacteraceae bacterium]|nr:hypothetical protein [Desulfobacteraceae bacterium]MBC2757311.1 hypothetical protein [Desulfobacteraceae bacterium]